MQTKTRIAAGATVLAAVVAGGVGGAVLGVPALSGASQFVQTTAAPGASGTSGSTTPPPRPGAKGEMLDAAAKALHLTPQQLRDKLSDGKTTIADVAKAQNVPLSDVTAAMLGVAKSDIDQIVNTPWPQHPKGGFPGGAGAMGPMGPGGPGKFGGRGLAGASIDAVAKALNITPQQLFTDLRNGQSIADIAKAQKVDVNGLIDQLVKDATDKINQAQQNGMLTQQQADALKQNLKQHITDLVNNALPKHMGGFGGFRMGGGGSGSGGYPGAPLSPPGGTTPTS